MEYTSLISSANKDNISKGNYNNLFYRNKSKKNLPKHKGDFKNYPVTNRMFNLGLTPAKIIDKDGDKIVSWEDCNDNNPNEYGLWSSVKSAVSKVVSKVKSTASKIGPAIQGNNYGTGTSVGGTTVISTGQSVTTTGVSQPSGGASVVSVPTKGGGGSYNPSTQTYTSPIGQKQSMAASVAQQKGLVSSAQLSAQQRGVQTSQAQQAQMQKDIQSGKYKPNLYYSAKPGWKPSRDPNATVIYLTKGGKATGNVYSGGMGYSSDNLKGFDTRASYYVEGKSGKTQRGGTLLAGSLQYEQPVDKKVISNNLTNQELINIQSAENGKLKDIYKKTFYTDKTGAKIIYNELGEKVLVPSDVSRIEYLKGSKGYEKFQDIKEPFTDVVAGLTAIPRMTAPIFNTIFDFGRREDDKSLVTGKAYRGGLAYGKFYALASNPFTGIPTALYYGSELGFSFVKDPLGTTQSVTSYIKEEPFEFFGAMKGAKKGGEFYKDPLKKVEVKKLKEELTKLGEKDFADATVVKLGEGSKINSDRVQIKGSSRTSDFSSDFEVVGDLVTNKKGYTFFPEGQGVAKITGKFKTPKTKERLFTNVQNFEVGGKSQGIPLKNMGKVEIGTAIGSSTFIPKQSVTQIIKNPRNIYESVKESVRLKVKKPIKESGGTIFKHLETDLTPRSALVKVEGETTLKRYGVTTSRGRRGSFFEFKEPSPEVVKVKSQSATFKKTPLSKTFGTTEPVNSAVDLVSPRMKTQAVKVETLGMVSKSVQGGTTQTAIRNVGNIPRMTGGLGLKQIPFSGTGLYSRSEERLKLKTLQDIDQKTEQDTGIKFLTGQITIPTNIQQEKTTQVLAVIPKQITVPKQILVQTTTFFYGEVPSPKPPIRTPIIPIIGFPKKKPRYVKGKGYIPFVRVEGTTKPKYEQISDVPMTKESALSSVARRVDKGIETVGKVIGAKQQTDKKTGKKIKARVLDTKDKYLEQNAHKFRGWTQRKGAKIGLQNTLIEKRRFRSDHPRELRALAAGRKKRTPLGF